MRNIIVTYLKGILMLYTADSVFLNNENIYFDSVVIVYLLRTFELNM
jgi:hypothetical protein